MTRERTIPPTPARLQAARRAGLRPRSPWVGRGLVLLAFAAAFDLGGDVWLRLAEGASWRIGSSVGTSWVPLRWALGVAAVLAFGFVVLVLAGQGLWGLGPRRERAIRRLSPVTVPRSPWRRPALAIVAAFFLVSTLREVVAGAARAPDASIEGLWMLWSSWGQRTLASAGLAMLAVGLFDFVLEVRRLRRALALPPGVSSSRAADPGPR